jgi:uncharacterized membrane protein
MNGGVDRRAPEARTFPPCTSPMLARPVSALPLSGIDLAMGDCFLLGYGYFCPTYATLVLYMLVHPINLLRLHQMFRLIKQAEAATQGAQSLDWLKPFMSARGYKKRASSISAR